MVDEVQTGGGPTGQFWYSAVQPALDCSVAIATIIVQGI